MLVLSQSDPESRPVTAEGDVATLKSMSERLQAAIRGGWGSYPVIPLDNIAGPQQGTVWITQLAEVKKHSVVGWPREEYRNWQRAWAYIADTTLHRLGAAAQFPLGDGAAATNWYNLVAATQASPPDASVVPTLAQIDAFGRIQLLPSITDGLTAVTTLLAEYKRTTGQTAGKVKPSGSTKLIIGLAVAALTGGAIAYYYRYHYRKPAELPATR